MLTDYVYNSYGVLTDLLHKSGSTVKQGYSYEYDNAYNITKQTQEDGSFRYNTTSGERLQMRFQLDRAELRYFDGTTNTIYTNTGVKIGRAHV